MKQPRSLVRPAVRCGNHRILVFLLVSVLAGCSSGGGDDDGPLSAQDWRRDIDFLASESARIHPNLFHSITRGEYESEVARLKDDAANLTRTEIFVRMKELVALPATREDGHAFMPMYQATGFRIYPLRLYEFADGVFVIGASAAHADAIGKRVEQIGGTTLDQVNAIVDPLITRDNESTAKYKRTLHYVVPEILETLDIVQDAQEGDYLLDDGAGNFSSLRVQPIDTDTYTDTETLGNSIGLPDRSDILYLSDRRENFWLQLLDNGSVLYVKYNLVWHETSSGETIAEFSDRIVDLADTVQKVIVDVRHNGGGNAMTFGPLLDALSSNAVDQPGKLFVLIDRLTFSAAANFVTRVDNDTGASFAGESTGGSLNNYGDVASFDLPRSGFGVRIPTIYWVYALPGDQRISIEPDLAVEVTSSDFFAGVDPVLEAVMAL